MVNFYAPQICLYYFRPYFLNEPIIIIYAPIIIIFIAWMHLNHVYACIVIHLLEKVHNTNIVNLDVISSNNAMVIIINFRIPHDGKKHVFSANLKKKFIFCANWKINFKIWRCGMSDLIQLDYYFGLI